jgi:hypothetical protein
MRLRCLRNVLIISIAFMGGLLATGIISTRTAVAQQPSEPFHSRFRYIILSTEVHAIGDQQMRGVEVLLDSTAFSEGNLKELFALLSKRYPEPQWMDASVLTSLEQVRTPEEFDLYGRAQFSGAKSYPLHYDDYDLAIFMRHGEDHFFRYTVRSIRPERDMKTVVLKGYDPATHQRAKTAPGR